MIFFGSFICQCRKRNVSGNNICDTTTSYRQFQRFGTEVVHGFISENN